MLYFVRHGQTDWNRELSRCQGESDVPLNATGRRQAREAGARLISVDIRRILSSHLLRALLEGGGTQVSHSLRVRNGQTLTAPCGGLVARINRFLRDSEEPA